MKVGKQFNTLTYGEYLHLIANYKKFTDFNTLGLFRSIVETTKLSPAEKLELRQVAIATFAKPFDFLQLKDPVTYIEVTTLGEKLTAADKEQAWANIRHNQQRILSGKKLRHRNFGTYSKHLCGYDTCPLNGLMIKQDSWLAYPSPCKRSMRLPADNTHYSAGEKSKMRKQDRKSERYIIAQCLAAE